MKIIFTTDTIHRGGKERQLIILARSLVDRGKDVSVITRNFSKDNFLNEYGLNESIINVFKDKNRLNEFHHFRELVFSKKPDLLISWDFQTSLFALVLRRKFYFHFINASIQHGIRLLKLSHILRSMVCFLSPFIIANSYTGLKANNLNPGKRRFVLYNGTETKFLNNLTKTEIEDLKKNLIPGYRENPGLVYISVAGFVPYKDYFTVLKALARLKEKSMFYYFIIGDGPMRSEIEKAVKNSGLEERVILAGRTENVRDYLFASDMMIHSSRGEGISNAILEGMHAGLPVIATNVGGIPETVFPGSSMLFPYKDHESLYQCLLRSLELKASFDPTSDDYQRYLKKFSVDTMVNRLQR